jgi:hypothetical protein
VELPEPSAGDGADEGADAGDGDVLPDQPDRPDVRDDGVDGDTDDGRPSDDGEAPDDGEASEDGEPSDDGGDGTDDSGAVCGNGVREVGEDCDSDSPVPCTTSCGDGLQRCVGCHWTACETSTVEVCNDLDDDCDGQTDEGFQCRRGLPTDCPTSCGSTGSTVCSASCTIASCPPPSESCNGADDDCDTVTDNGYACRLGAPVSCTTTCGTTGSGFCTSTCALPLPADCTPPAETCNGVDDNCNALTDEGLWSAASPEVRITTTADRSVRPALVWKADTRQYGLAYEEEATAGSGGSIYFALLDESGSRDLATDAAIAVPAGATRHEHPVLTWSAAQWGIVWSQYDGTQSDLHFRWASANGGTLGSSQVVAAGTNRSDEPVITWVGAEYGVAWNDSRDGNLEVYFTRLTSSGTLPGGYTAERVTMSSTCASSRPTLAWTGTEYGLAWDEWCTGDSGDIYCEDVGRGADSAGFVAGRGLGRRCTGRAEARVGWHPIRDGLAG